MAKRKIIKIDHAKCNGCGICADACHEAAIKIENGKAALIRDEYCDGLGDCLPACPMQAISFEEREADAYNAALVKQRLAESGRSSSCKGSKAVQFQPQEGQDRQSKAKSELKQWPLQIKLAPVQAVYYDSAKLLIAADCSAFARGDFHSRFMRGSITLIGCPKLDMVDYSEKLAQILQNNEIQNITVVRMEVPCCCGIENAVRDALSQSKKSVPFQLVTLSTRGEILGG